MTKQEAVALAKRINQEDRRENGDRYLEAIEAQLGVGTGYYLVAIHFYGSGSTTLITHEGEWQFLKALRNGMSDEERKALHRVKVNERRNKRGLRPLSDEEFDEIGA